MKTKFPLHDRSLDSTHPCFPDLMEYLHDLSIFSKKMPPTIRDKIKDLELICPLLIGVRQQPAAALLKSPCGYLIGILPRSSRLERDRLSSNDSGLPLYVPGLCRVVEPKRLPEILMLTKAIEVISCHIVFEVKKAGGHKYLGHGVEIVPDIFDEMEGEKVHW